MQKVFTPILFYHILTFTPLFVEINTKGSARRDPDLALKPLLIRW